MSNSPLVNYTKISPNKTSPRTHAIDTITIHCVVGQCSAERLGEIFTPTTKQASCNYGIGYDGRIALIVEEKDRSWCSSNSANDNRAITIEVASDTTHPYAVNDAAYKSLINLLVDICQRNNIKELKWQADKSLIGQPDKQNMTVHRWFANKACPGEYLYSRHGQIAAEVNARLNGEVVEEPVKVEPTQTDSKPTIQVGSTGEYVKKAQELLNKHGASLNVDGIFGALTLAAVKNFQKEKGLDVDGIVGPKTWAALEAYKDCKLEATVEEKEAEQVTSYPIVKSGSTGTYVKKAQELLNKHGASLNVDGDFGSLTLAAVKKFQKEKGLDVDGIVGPKTWAALEAEPKKIEEPTAGEFEAYKVKVTSAALNVRSGPSVNYGINMCIRDKGIYTIVEESDGWGKLKSGAGWINLDYTKRV